MIIEQLLRQHLSYSEIQSITGLSKATISYHAKRLGISRQTQRVYDWEKIQSEISKGVGISSLCKKYKAPWSVIKNAIKQGKITDPKNYSKIYDVNNCFEKSVPRRIIKKIIIEEKLLENKCHCCGSPPVWNNKKLVLVLDHINGINNDNRIENLRLLCPNCNSQTDTFCGKNTKKKIALSSNGSDP